MKVLLAEVLARLAAELRASAHDSATLEAIVQEALAAQATNNPPGVSHTIQHMDLLTQTLADFARFAETLAVQVPDYVVNIEDALAALHLRDLRHGLAGQRFYSARDPGHVDVF